MIVFAALMGCFSGGGVALVAIPGLGAKLRQRLARFVGVHE